MANRHPLTPHIVPSYRAYPQNGERVVSIDFVTSFQPIFASTQQTAVDRSDNLRELAGSECPPPRALTRSVRLVHVHRTAVHAATRPRLWSVGRCVP